MMMTDSPQFNRPKFQLPANHIIISPTKADSAYLKKLGFNAIHNPFREDDWESAHSLEHLEGKAVIVVCDDGDVTTDCNGLLEAIVGSWGSYRKIILSDKISNLSKDGILKAILDAILSETFRFKDTIIRAEDFISEDIPPKKTILKPWLTVPSINNISGWRGTGKTWLAASIVDAITRGEPFGPWRTETPVPVCYVDGELPSSDVQERFRVVASLTKSKRKAPLYSYSESYANSLGLPRTNLSNPIWKEAFKEFLIKEGFKILVLDNIASLSPGICENAKEDWDPNNQWFLELRFSGISTIPIFHAGKKGGQRGTSAHEDNVDTSIILSPPPFYSPQHGARFNLKFTKTRVKNADLHMIGDYEFSFSEVNGRAKWDWKPVKGRNRIDILKLIDAGMKQSKIAKALGIDKGYVSRTKADAIKKGLLTQEGKLTQQGLCLFNTEDSDEEL